jgi:hypothetical protein
MIDNFLKCAKVRKADRPAVDFIESNHNFYEVGLKKKSPNGLFEKGKKIIWLQKNAAKKVKF